MPTNVRLTKTAVNKLLVNERKAMREKQKQSAFLRKTNNIYQAMKKRAADVGQALDFPIEDMRWWMQMAMLDGCEYCRGKVAVCTVTLDHFMPIARGGSFQRANLRVCCKSCNWQKGTMTGDEFTGFLVYLLNYAPEVQADIKRRLTIGGKWGVRV